MKKTQILTYNQNLKKMFNNNLVNNYEINSIDSPKDFDEFDINIVDLTTDSIWRYSDSSPVGINCISDLTHYSNLVKNSRKSKCIVILPQNIKYKYYLISGEYQYNKYMKNLLSLLQTIVYENIYKYNICLEFGKSITTINSIDISADFNFTNIDSERELIKSTKSNKITALKINDDLIYTTLDVINSQEVLEIFLRELKLLNDEELIIPTWLENINFNDDEQINNALKEINEKIEILSQKKMEQKTKKEKNIKIKSILFSSGTTLQLEVASIFNDIFSYEDPNFIDNMEEDYRLKRDNVTYLIETKGLKGNIKGTQVSEAKNHLEVYVDKNDCENNGEMVKCVFVVGTEIEKEPKTRQELPDRQVNLARVNEIAIIRVETLLKLYEDYLKGIILPNKIDELIINTNGELKY